ncbi:hypothetical protein SETIT_6G185300v2 [Setaria italica]|uniref:Uncharacterized protein n=1 Tax=Setaria italica TaxID=4555 RepID=A0A368RPL3_SETIT|nr:hypothetical protein SETIT_6G185300v2 [Setaria italica]
MSDRSVSGVSRKNTLAPIHRILRFNENVPAKRLTPEDPVPFASPSPTLPPCPRNGARARGRDKCRRPPRAKRGSCQSESQTPGREGWLTCGRRGARETSATSAPGRSEPSGASSGRRVDEEGRATPRVPVGRSVGRAGAGRDDAAPRRRRPPDASDKSERSASRKRQRAALILSRRLRLRLLTRGPASIASGDEA